MFAPSLACLYMYQFEKLFILPTDNPFFDHIKLWRRYIDDILIIWQGPLQIIDVFTNWINTLDPFLRFTAHVSTTQVPFLDLMIQILNGKLVTDTYHKSTDRNSLLLYDSHHPKALRDNLPFGQFLRLRRNCSTAQLFEAQASELKDKLRHRHYPTKVINPAYKRARHNHREALLAPNMRAEQSRLTCYCLQKACGNDPFVIDKSKVLIFPEFTANVQAQRGSYLEIKKDLHEEGIQYSLMFPARLQIILNGATHVCSTPEDEWTWLEAHKGAYSSQGLDLEPEGLDNTLEGEPEAALGSPH
ncbi:hypothetical protein NDU88_005450 [Pleurodeles waltl]|uniref:Helix-turn-helix domain-containing protein n=1 Tax=Pleurodeles waltl TaxID=8319 RepID=A0AAV7RP99_PLEWA|nr:hypothetical protein NDU88_005450 [Pleurodeles waltl]